MSESLPGLRRYIDLFCGIGGFHIAADNLDLECVFASDIDTEARKVYYENSGIHPSGDITICPVESIPAHDLLFAGFPCQPFSIIGDRQGFSDERNGNLFFEIVRILEHHRPTALVLENVKQLATAQKGKVMKTILSKLMDLGYDVEWRVLNALDFGLPQKRERVLIVGSQVPLNAFRWPEEPLPMRPLSEILETNPHSRHFVSERIRQARHKAHKTTIQPAIWHENKAGNISSHPFSCALRAGASYNYLLVDGVRRLTPREQAKLQGFPDTFTLHTSDTHARRQFGNAVPVPMVQSVINQLLDAYEGSEIKRQAAAQ